MIYLDHGATSFPKPPSVTEAVIRALRTCANPGRGGHKPAMEAARTVFACRERAAQLFDCKAEQVVFTASCTHGLNIAIRTLVKPGDPVVISGFEHNAVTRPLQGLGAKIQVVGRRLFDPEDTVVSFEKALQNGVKVAIFTHVSNVFGYILPINELSDLCRKYGVPFVIDAAQSAGSLPVQLEKLGADFIAMPGHKGLLGPQGTGILLCGRQPEPLLFGGTGSHSASWEMPDWLPDRLEAGTVNVPGIAGLERGLALVQQGMEQRHNMALRQSARCATEIKRLGCRVFTGTDQSAVFSFVPPVDCEVFAQKLGQLGVGVRAGLHCAPLAHESAGTLDTGTVRISFGYDASPRQTQGLLRGVKTLLKR